jgi:hypothetical protein
MAVPGKSGMTNMTQFRGQSRTVTHTKRQRQAPKSSTSGTSSTVTKRSKLNLGFNLYKFRFLPLKILLVALFSGHDLRDTLDLAPVQLPFVSPWAWANSFEVRSKMFPQVLF